MTRMNRLATAATIAAAVLSARAKAADSPADSSAASLGRPGLVVIQSPHAR